MGVFEKYMRIIPTMDTLVLDLILQWCFRGTTTFGKPAYQSLFLLDEHQWFWWSRALESTVALLNLPRCMGFIGADASLAWPRRAGVIVLLDLVDQFSLFREWYEFASQVFLPTN